MGPRISQGGSIFPRLAIFLIFVITILLVHHIDKLNCLEQESVIVHPDGSSSVSSSSPSSPLSASIPQPHPSSITMISPSGEQQDSSSFVSSGEDRNQELMKRREAVKQAFVEAFAAYSKYSYGNDELRPVSNQSQNPFGGFGVTIVDSLDTMLLMNLTNEFEKGINFVERHLSFDKDVDVSVFELTIRIMGGLISAYQLSGSKFPILLNRARELADRLLPSFNTPNGIPYTVINLKTGIGRHPQWHKHYSILSEIGSIQLEFKTLSHLVGDTKYEKAVETVMNVLDSLRKPLDGLYPVYIRTDEARFHGEFISFGALGDSFYEILLKQYLLTGKKDEKYLRMFKESMRGFAKYLLKRSIPNGLYFVAEHRDGNAVPKQDHLVCFLPGTIALSVMELNDTHIIMSKDNIYQIDDVELAKQLTKTCYLTYEKQATGISPEITHFNVNQDKTDDFHNQAKHYLLRPETIESLYMLYRMTNDSMYQDWGWNIFENIQKYCKTANGAYSGIDDVMKNKPVHNDVMESFFLSETLKYLYLLFHDTSFIASDYIFTTEGHALKRF